jgi:hypothetical protein
MARIALNPIQAAAVDGDDSALNINQIVLAQVVVSFRAYASIVPHRGARGNSHSSLERSHCLFHSLRQRLVIVATQ